MLTMACENQELPLTRKVCLKRKVCLNQKVFQDGTVVTRPALQFLKLALPFLFFDLPSAHSRTLSSIFGIKANIGFAKNDLSAFS